MERQVNAANVKRELWETPRTEFEMFVPNEYIAACADDGHYELLPGAVAEPSAKFYLDYNRNGIYDAGSEANWVNTSNTGREPGENAISYWGWKQVNDRPDTSTRYRLFQVQNDGQYKAYGEQWVTNKNHS